MRTFRLLIFVFLVFGLAAYGFSCGGGDTQQEADTQGQVDDGGDDGVDGDGSGDDGGDGDTTKVPLNIFEFGDLLVDGMADKLAKAYFEVYGSSFTGIAKYAGAREDMFTVPDFSQPVTYDKEGIKMICREGQVSEYDMDCFARLNFDIGDIHVEGDCRIHFSVRDTTSAYELDDGIARLGIQLRPGVYEEEGSNPLLPGILMTSDDEIRLVAGFYNLTADRLIQELILLYYDAYMYLNEASGGYDGTPYGDRSAFFYFPTLDVGDHLWIACRFDADDDTYNCDYTYTLGEDCSDKVDNDVDGLIDCDDPDCVPCARECVFEDCMNGVDDDDNGLVDCEDQDCHFFGECYEECDNTIDDDGDGLTDCDDPRCFDQSYCGEQICDDEIDNDENGAADCDDPYCIMENTECGVFGPYSFKCDIDDSILGMDLSCEDYQGPHGYDLPRGCIDDIDTGDTWCLEKCEQQCGDFIDNDLDGAIDCMDSDCEGVPPYCND
jgi:hypothetical protein